MIMPPPHLLETWRKGRQMNDTTGNLAQMSKWFASVVRRGGMADAICAKAKSYADIFAALAAIHKAEGYLPVEVYAYRGISMRGFLQLAEYVDSDVKKALVARL